MTKAQREAYVCGVVPGHHESKFFSQHLSAYAFAKTRIAGKKVLEIGFGDGYGTNFLAECAREVVGIDLAPGNAPRAAAKYPRPNLAFLHMDAGRLDFPDETFDAVCSFQVIEHIPEPQLVPAVTDVRRILKPGGLYIVSTLNLDHNMKPGRPYEKLEFHEKEFTAPELRKLLETVFPDVEMYGLYPTPRHAVYERLKKWKVGRLLPAGMDPVAKFYRSVTTGDFRVSPRVTRAALDLIAVCRKA